MAPPRRLCLRWGGALVAGAAILAAGCCLALVLAVGAAADGRRRVRRGSPTAGLGPAVAEPPEPGNGEEDGSGSPGRRVIVGYRRGAGLGEADLRARIGGAAESQLEGAAAGAAAVAGAAAGAVAVAVAVAGCYTDEDIAALAARPDIAYVEDDPPVHLAPMYGGGRGDLGGGGRSSSRGRHRYTRRRARTRRAANAAPGTSVGTVATLNSTDADPNSVAAQLPPRPPLADPYGIRMTQTDQVRAAVDPETGLPIRAVCVIDTGIDANHEDLPRVNVEGRSFGLNVGGWNSSMDGHGTHVAGTAVALAGGGWGSSPAGGTGIGSAVRGVEGGGNLKLLVARVFDSERLEETRTSTLVQAAYWCASRGAHVINMSLGSEERSQAEAVAMEWLYESAGILLVAAAGNRGHLSNRPNYPASLQHVMSVGMVGEDGTVPPSSQRNYGVEITAPGVSILSTTATGTGTLAAYVVNGTAHEAIAMDYAPTTDGGNGGTTAHRGNVTGALVDCGYGEVDCHRPPPPAVPTVAEAGPLGGTMSPRRAAPRPFVCLMKRGSPDPDPWASPVTFADKVAACERGGGGGCHHLQPRGRRRRPGDPDGPEQLDDPRRGHNAGAGTGTAGVRRCRRSPLQLHHAHLQHFLQL